MTLLTAGFLVNLEILRLYPTVITIFIGVLVGDLALYSIGWKWGKGIFTHRYMRKVFSENRLENVVSFSGTTGTKPSLSLGLSPVSVWRPSWPREA